MRTLRKLFLMLILIGVIRGVIFAGAGSDNMVFLKFSPSVRANSLADTTVSFPMDVNNMFYNPAGAFTFNSFDLGLSYTLWFQSINFLHFAGKMNFPGIGNFGIGFVSVLYDDIFKTEERNGVLEKTDSKLELTDYYFMMNYNRSFGERFFAGVNLKFAHNKVDISTKNGIGGDIGAIYLLTDNISMGLSILNTGISDAPLVIKAGAGYNKDFSKTLEIIVSGEVDRSGSAGIEGGVGVEFKFMRMFFIRTGYRISETEGNFRIGAGVKLKSITVDYSFTGYGELGNVNRIGFKMGI